ncbi:MAG: T9SS type A sorting domain-containing protein [Bacteroidetes bacterium]|nr:T9SS type A sorting domain-containing protein [Bacteroidota bacterium]MBS1633137.1 T9SS type A sorting domain-containing protein [Bacteroidota bacterium]
MKKITLSNFSKNYNSLKISMTASLFLFTGSLLAQINPPAPPAPKPATNNCTAEVSTPCPAGSFSASFSGGDYVDGTGTGSGNSVSRSMGAVWRYANVANISGQQINATVKIDTIFNATVSDVDNDNAVDQNNNTVPTWFTPSIAPTNAGSGSSSHRGYVQFTFTFFKANVGDGYTDSAKLLGINYTHYDIDGLTGSGYSLRETGLVQDVSQLTSVAANANTELVAYNYSTGTKNWKGFAASTTTRNGTTSCSEVVASFKYNAVNNPVSSVSVRMGYEYVRTGSGSYGSQARLYASKFGCFNFPQESTLPVRLISFSGSYKSQASLLSWDVADEISFDHYEIERSSTGYDFAKVGVQQALGTTSGNRQYQYTDDLSIANGNIFYYRLKMVDIDGKSKYSNVIMIRKDQNAINGISIAPNPVTNGMATLRLSATAPGSVDLRVIDFTGKVMLRQQNHVYEGNNSISLNNLGKLMPGIYTLQLINGETVTSSKFSIIK